MALCRCLELHSWPIGKKASYVSYVFPIGYPSTALICGITNCCNPGVIWLTESEKVAYENGQRIFTGPNAFAKMKASENGLYQPQQIKRPRITRRMDIGCQHQQSLSPEWVDEKLRCINPNAMERTIYLENMFIEKFHLQNASLTPDEFAEILKFKGLARSVENFLVANQHNDVIQQATEIIFTGGLNFHQFNEVIQNEALQNEILQQAENIIENFTQMAFVGRAVASAALRLAFPQLFGTADWIVPGLMHCLVDGFGITNPFIEGLEDREQFLGCLIMPVNNALSPAQSRAIAKNNYRAYTRQLWMIKQRFNLPQTIAQIETSLWSYGICYMSKQNRRDNLAFKFSDREHPAPPVGGLFSKNCQHLND
jgi:hypothetical protein